MYRKWFYISVLCLCLVFGTSLATFTARAKVFLVAHDGYLSDRFSGNTIEAVYKAMENNIHFVELLVNMAKDGTLTVISHDILENEFSRRSMKNADGVTWYELTESLKRYIPRNQEPQMSQLLLPHIFKLNYFLEKFPRNQFIIKLNNADPYETAHALHRTITAKQWPQIIVIPFDRRQGDAIRYSSPMALLATSQQEFQFYAEHFLNTRSCKAVNPSRHYWITLDPVLLESLLGRSIGDRDLALSIRFFLLNFVSCVRHHFPTVRFILTDPNNHNLAQYLRVEMLYVNDLSR